ncbi:Arc family DNA-binding protein [Halomonas sp. H2]|uniref:Arc family DNA-binding protein n=1 Tax=unclassified Halomonas TaxID=2609666 RepID=UPI003CEE7D6E
MTTHDTHIQYKLRMPPGLHDKLKASAKENHRSLNAEIVARLDESLSAGPKTKTISRGGFGRDKKLSKALQDLERALNQLHEVRDDQEKAVEESQPEKLDVKDDLLK